MKSYFIKRILLIFVTAFIILSLTFILMKLLKDPTPAGFDSQIFAYYQDQVHLGYAKDLTELTPSLGDYLYSYTDSLSVVHYIYKTPVMEQYWNFLVNVFTEWNWGTSTVISVNSSAIAIIGERLPVSMLLNVISIIVAVPIGFLFGIIAALRKNKLTDHVISTVVMVFISIPSFILITLLLLIFAYGTGWLPSQWPANMNNPETVAKALVIPVCALSFGTIASFTRYTRAELCEVMSSDFLLLARTKGLTKPQCVLRHALRNSLVPLVPMIIGQFIGILSGSMILENLYGIPGIGRLFTDALSGRDYNVLMVDMAIFTLIGLAANLLVDMSYGVVDPRIRMGAKK